jgi:hypothetical protein
MLNLDNGSYVGDVSAKPSHRGDDAFASDCASFQRFAVPHDDDKRNHPSEWKVDIARFLPRLT